jgi:hypothetical protein
MDIVTVFAISNYYEPKNPKVDAIKNNRLIHIIIKHVAVPFAYIAKIKFNRSYFEENSRCFG